MPHPFPSTPAPQALVTTLRTALEVLHDNPALRVPKELALHMGLALLQAALSATPLDEPRHGPA